MTTEELKKKHPAFSGSELHNDLIKWFEAKHPIHGLPAAQSKEAGMLLTGAPVLLNHLGGFQKAIQELKDIPNPPQVPTPEPPDTFKDDEIKTP